jgi:hypothetical protein
MGLKSLVQKGAKTAFKVLGKSDQDGLNISFVYTAISADSQFNPSTLSVSPSTVTRTLEGVLYAIKDEHVDGINSKFGDSLLIFPTPSPDLSPSTRDTVTTGGSTYRIVGFKRDPAKATHTLHLRRA